MKKLNTMALFLATLLATFALNSYAEKPSLAAVEAQLRTTFAAAQPALPVARVAETPVEGLYAVQVQDGPLLYVTADGEFFVLGDLYQVTQGRYVNLAEQAREAGRAELLASVAVEDMIVFAPQQQPSKAVVSVFTDVDCFYCQKLHREVPALNKMGIEVRYLAYPRAGLGSDSFNKVASAWCAKDKQTALTKLKNREKIPTNVCADNPIAAHFELGNKMGVTGTPALITPEGRLMPGYMPAQQLAKLLGVQ